MYKKILQSIYLCSGIALAITVSGIILYSLATDSITIKFSLELFPILLIFALVYLAVFVSAHYLVSKIVKPITELDLSGNNNEKVYPELIPILSRLERQNNEISRQIDRVKRQKNRLWVLGESMSDGLIVFDSDVNIISLNSSAANIFGTDQKAIGENFLNISRSIEIFEAIERACRGKKGVISETISGKLYQIYLSPSKDKGSINSVIMLIFDVSEMEKSEKIRREFTANVSHELKTPLTTILGYSQIINNGIAKSEDIIDFTNRIEKETTRLITLVDDIMKLSKLDEASIEPEFSEIHLAPLVKDISERLAHKAQSRNISIKTNELDTVINGDISQITELIYNLMDNAIKYNRENGEVFVTIGGQCIAVSDTGIGIPEKYLDRVYERFFRVDKSHSKKIGGTGLGLSIVKHIAQQHNANITLESEENKGSTFTVTFPQI